ncbi:C40 family peptidase [Streptomyces sp. NPDC002004]
MSGRLARWVCTAATAALTLAPLGTPTAAPAAAAPRQKSVADLLTDLQRLYREAEAATETYDATAEKLKQRRDEVRVLGGKSAEARRALHRSRADAGRLARQQYQGSGDFSPYVRLLLSHDPQHLLEQGHMLQRVASERAGTVSRLADDERKADRLAVAARAALDDQQMLAQRQKKQRDDVEGRLKQVERLLATLSPDQVAELARLESSDTAAAQQKLLASGALAGTRAPSENGNEAVRYAVRQIGKPYVWGAQGPDAYDCSGLTSQAWAHAGRAIPRTSQQQWATLRRVPLKELRPGDLVVYFPEATHVALYLGGGMVVQAPRPGASVKVSPIAANPVLGAVRPDPGRKSLRSYVPPVLPMGSGQGSDRVSWPQGTGP